MAFDSTILGKALGEPRLLDEDEIRELARWAEKQRDDADRLAHDLRNAPARTERIQWVASILGLVIVALGITAAIVTYAVLDTRKYDTDSIRLQTCAIRKDIDKIDSQLREMCEDE